MRVKLLNEVTAISIEKHAIHKSKPKEKILPTNEELAKYHAGEYSKHTKLADKHYGRAVKYQGKNNHIALHHNNLSKLHQQMASEHRNLMDEHTRAHHNGNKY